MIVNKAWRLIVSASATSAGVRGKRFRMSYRTQDLIRIERGTPDLPVKIYGVPIVRDDFMRDGSIELEGWA